MKTHLLVVLATWLVAQVGSREISRRKYERDEVLLAAQQDEEGVLPAVDPHNIDMAGKAASEEARNGAVEASDPAAFGEQQLPQGAAGAVEVNVESNKGTKHRHRHHQGEGQSVIGTLSTKQSGKHTGHRLQHKSKLPKKVTPKTHPTKDDTSHEVEGDLSETQKPHKEAEDDPLPHYPSNQDPDPEGVFNTHYVDLDLDQRLEEDFPDAYEVDDTLDKHPMEVQEPQPHHPRKEHHSGEVTHTEVKHHASSSEAVHASSGKEGGHEPVVLPVTTEGKNRSGNQDYAHYGLPLELMPILPGGGSRFDDVERERLEKASQSQKKNGDDDEGTGNAAESLHSGAHRFGLPLLQVVLLALLTRIH